MNNWNPEGLKTVCVDFNGVLDLYAGYTGGMYPIRIGAIEFLTELKRMGLDIVILTSADPVDIWAWLEHYGIQSLIKQVTNIKVPAIAYIDDRAIPFTGDFDVALETLKTFKCFWEDDNHRETPTLEVEDG